MTSGRLYLLKRTIKNVIGPDGTLARAVDLVSLKFCPEKSSVKTETPSVFEIHSGTAKVVIC